ncbi:MAG TPA: TetR/AcrR family transcriptional regulator [Solirubrobacterales bacterium]|nr:TetR/AcrR family transcriptional regulator [Solirubrobacterales bacterium]
MTSRAGDPPERGSLDSQMFPKDVFAPSERDDILYAMAAICVERGYTETTVTEVAARAGVSPETFARHFNGIEDCGFAAVNLIVAEIGAVTSAAWSSDSAEAESVVLAIKALLELLAARPSFAPLIYVQGRYAMPTSAYAPYRASIEVLASMVDRLRAYAPDKDQAPKTAAAGVLGSAGMVMRRAILAGNIERLPELLPDIVYGVLVPFLGQEGALRYTGRARELLNEGG